MTARRDFAREKLAILYAKALGWKLSLQGHGDYPWRLECVDQEYVDSETNAAAFNEYPNAQEALDELLKLHAEDERFDTVYYGEDEEYYVPKCFAKLGIFRSDDFPLKHTDFIVKFANSANMGMVYGCAILHESTAKKASSNGVVFQKGEEIYTLLLVSQKLIARINIGDGILDDESIKDFIRLHPC
jgi:hypothetical protein